MKLFRHFPPEGRQKQRGSRGWIETSLWWREMREIAGKCCVWSEGLFCAVALISQQRSAVNKTTVVWLFYTTATLKIYCLAVWGFTRCILKHADCAHQQMLINTHPADTIQDGLCRMLTSLIVKWSAQHCCLQWVLLDMCKHVVSETVERKFHHGSHSLRVLFSLSWRITESLNWNFRKLKKHATTL